MPWCLSLTLVLILGCGSSADAPDGSVDGAAPADADGAPPDSARPPGDGAAGDGATDAAVADGSASDAGGIEDTLAAQRARLFSTLSDDACTDWSALSASARAVFDTISHRLFLSKTPDGRSVLSHLERLYAVLGGGVDGTSCGGIENNRIFASMDPYLWEHMVATNDGTLDITDGGDGHWAPSGDIAGPHDPFDASNETETGLDCILLIETADSRPPTAQAHFFRAGSETTIVRGAVEIAPDPRAIEVDQDFDCIHRSNPTCSDFESRYQDHYGDFECAWVPPTCVPEGDACYPAASAP